MGRKSGLSVRVAGLSTLPASARTARLYETAVRLAFQTKKTRINGEVTVVFVTKSMMLKMNRRYLGHNDHTDVITFQHESIPGVPVAERPLGDILISAEMVRRQAKELSHTARHEAATLATHGALHLLGHDDAKPRAKARMFEIQERIVAAADRVMRKCEKRPASARR